MVKKNNEDIFDYAKKISSDPKIWAPDRIKQAERNIKAIESTYYCKKELKDDN